MFNKNLILNYNMKRSTLWLMGLLIVLAFSVAFVELGNPPPDNSTPITIIDVDSDFAETSLAIQTYQPGTIVLDEGEFACPIYTFIPSETVMIYTWESRYIPSYITLYT